MVLLLWLRLMYLGALAAVVGFCAWIAWRTRAEE
jgi:hypothetical protein